MLLLQCHVHDEKCGIHDAFLKHLDYIRCVAPRLPRRAGGDVFQQVEPDEGRGHGLAKNPCMYTRLSRDCAARSHTKHQQKTNSGLFFSFRFTHVPVGSCSFPSPSPLPPLPRPPGRALLQPTTPLRGWSPSRWLDAEVYPDALSPVTHLTYVALALGTHTAADGAPGFWKSRRLVK